VKGAKISSPADNKYLLSTCDNLKITQLTLQMYDVSTVSTPAVDSTQETEDQYVAFNHYFVESRQSHHLASFSLQKIPITLSESPQLYPIRSESGAFGVHLLQKNAFTPFNIKQKPIIITDTYWNALILHSNTGFPSIVIPDSGLCKNLLQMLYYEELYIWYGPDPESQEKAKKLVNVFGSMNIKNVVLPNEFDTPKTISEAVTAGLNLHDILTSNGDCVRPFIKSFDLLKKDVHADLFENNQRLGVQSKSLPALTNILGGLRKGEVTLISGHTGTGKVIFKVIFNIRLQFCHSFHSIFVNKES
jgi:ABC-type multidrug transport system fused ATPase/permease subunit